jgi:hypothetical protein
MDDDAFDVARSGRPGHEDAVFTRGEIELSVGVVQRLNDRGGI